MKIFTPTIFGDTVEAGLWFPGLDEAVTLHQLHGNHIHEVEKGIMQAPDGDGLITHEPGLLIAMRVADCVTVLLHDPEHKVVAAIHSGWRGTKAEIVPKAVERLKEQFQSDPVQLHAYISPAGQKCCYEVTEEFKDYFPAKYFEERNNKLYFDNSQLIFDQLIVGGLTPANIERDSRCTIHDKSFPSYRRDKTKERMFAAIKLN